MEFACQWRKMKRRHQVSYCVKRRQVKWLSCCVYERPICLLLAWTRDFIWRHILHLLSRTSPLPSWLGPWLPLLLFAAHIRFILTRTIPGQEGAFPFLRAEECGKARDNRDHDTDTATCPPNTLSPWCLHTSGYSLEALTPCIFHL